MNVKIAGALVGFTLGFIGYIVFKMWLKPIRKYLRLKADIKTDIKSYMTCISEQTWNKLSKKRFKNTRQKITDLTDCYNYDIPVWYKIMLRHRQESPVEAAKHLMDLANVRDDLHALNRLTRAEAALLIKQPEGNHNS